MRILILEDRIAFRMNLTNIITERGDEVVAAVASGEDAWEAFEAAENEENPIDIALLDIRVEGNLTGIDVAQKINTLRTVPVIYISAYPEAKEKAEAEFPMYFLSKNDEYEFKLKNLLDNLNTLISANVFNGTKTFSDKLHIGINVQFGNNCLLIKNRGEPHHFKINADDIFYIESADQYIKIYTAMRDINDPYWVHTSLSKLLNYAAANEWNSIVRIHRQFAVNAKHILRIENEVSKVRLRRFVKVFRRGEEKIPFDKEIYGNPDNRFPIEVMTEKDISLKFTNTYYKDLLEVILSYG